LGIFPFNQNDIQNDEDGMETDTNKQRPEMIVDLSNGVVEMEKKRT
jgi:hypothetical protein